MAKPLIDYKKIKLENERTGSTVKRLNRLTTWQFFKVLYRNDMFKMIGLNLLMLIFLAPALIVQLLYYAPTISALTAQLPNANVVGIGANVWLGVGEYFTQQVAGVTNSMRLLWIPAFALLAFAISGGMAVIRDSFWTGKLVVFKPFFKGIAQSIAYVFVGTLILSAEYYGVFALNNLLTALLPQWSVIIIMILAWGLLLFSGLYLYTLFTVVTTYKQDFVTNLADAWRLLFLNFIPNFFSFAITILPFVLYFAFGTNLISMLLMALFFMFGMFYVVFVYTTNMMRTFALFHPVEKKKQSSSSNTPNTPTQSLPQTTKSTAEKA